MLGGLDIPLLAYFFFWYLGNYYYNISNKTALKAAGGALGYPMTISTLQLGVGSLYALFLWAAPDARSFPSITAKDIVKLLPVAFCAAGAHAGSVFALSAGAVSFGQIVKAAEPAFAAVVGTKLYGRSRGPWSAHPRHAALPRVVVGGFVSDFAACTTLRAGKERQATWLSYPMIWGFHVLRSRLPVCDGWSDFRF